MSAPIPTGSIITYQSDDWHTKSVFISPDDVLHSVETALIADGITARPGSAASVGFGAEVAGVASLSDIKFSVTLLVQITGGLGYNSADDVASIINHEVYATTGYLPSSSSVPKVQLPGNASVSGLWNWFGSLFSGSQSTGQPSDPSTGFSLSNLTSSGTLYIALALFGFIGALALIGYSGALKHGGE